MKPDPMKIKNKKPGYWKYPGFIKACELQVDGEQSTVNLVVAFGNKAIPAGIKQQ